ncbi:MAG: glycosyltransferase family 2 protein [Breznakibacter sp.]
MNPGISIVIISKDNEKSIETCLESVKWADEIVVVDSGSSDRTIDICNRFGCKVIKTPWLGFGKTKRLAVENAEYEWVLSIDTDEACSVDLQKRIMQIISSEKDVKGYRIKRRTYFLGNEIRYSGWQKDFPLRLFRKENGNFNENIVHESVELKGKIGVIKEIMFHYSYPNMEIVLGKMNLYTSLGANKAFLKGKKSSLLGAIFRGYFKFLKMYILKLGFLDGVEGYILAKQSAFGILVKYVKLYECQQEHLDSQIGK